MEISHISKSILFAAVFLTSIGAFSKSNNFLLMESTILSDSIFQAESTALAIFRINSTKKFILPKNKLVRVYCPRSKEHSSLKRARITAINSGQITFTPTSKKFEEVTYSESTLHYIEFITAGTVVRGVIVNTVVICTVVVATGVIIVLTRRNPHLWGGNGAILDSLIDDFHKHISVYKSNGDKQWEIMTIGVVQ